MKRKNKINNKKKVESRIDIVKTKKEATFLIITGLILFVGFLLFFMFFYRPFVPWKKIVCSDENGTFIELNDRDIKYIYEIDGVVYEKILYNVPFPANGSNADYSRWIIYVNVNNPTDVKSGTRGGIGLVVLFIVFIITGGYMIGLSIYKFNQLKANKDYIKKRK